MERNTDAGARSKPDGGFTGITLTQIAMIWVSYLTAGIAIGIVEVRAYLAALELVQRRKTEEHIRRRLFTEWKKTRQGPCPKPVEPHYRLEELSTLMGEPLEKVRRAVKRLEETGLLTFTPTRISFAMEPEELQVESTAPIYEMLRTLSPRGGWNRIVPLPRRIITVLAETGSRSVIATVLGFVARCCFYFSKEKKYTYVGRCKSSWISESFGISLAATKAARSFLVSIEFLRPLETPQLEMNKKGGLVQVNPAFGTSQEINLDEVTSEASSTQTSANPETPDEGAQEPKLEEILRQPDSAGTSAALEKDELLVSVDPTWHRLSGTDVSSIARTLTDDEERKFSQPSAGIASISGQPIYEEEKESSARLINQNQASCPAAGKATRPDQTSKPSAEQSGSGICSDHEGQGLQRTWATLHITSEDLRSTETLLDYYDLACQAGVITRSQNSELKFIAFAERARLRGTSSPGGFLRSLVEKDLVNHLTEAQWECANRRINAFRYGGTPPRDFTNAEPSRALSEGVLPEGRETGPKDPAAASLAQSLKARELQRKESEEKRNRKIAEFIISRTPEEKEKLKAEALANAEPFIVNQYERCLREENAQGAKLYLDTLIYGWCEKMLSSAESPRRAAGRNDSIYQ
jgi:hypothetical protein